MKKMTQELVYTYIVDTAFYLFCYYLRLTKNLKGMKIVLNMVDYVNE